MSELYDFTQKSDWKSFAIDLAHPVEPPEPLIIQSDSEIPFLHRRNLSTIAAQAKVGKTFLTSAIAASALNSEGFLNFNSTKETKVLFIDTEQDISDTQNIIRRIHRICSLNSEANHPALLAVNIREIEIEQRLKIIESAIRDEKPDLVLLDGIVDLVTDFNNISDSSKAVTLLAKWATQYDTHIMSCIHLNKGVNELRGHLGAFLRQKGEITLLLEKKEDIVPYIAVKPIDSRRRPIDEFAFRINDNGLPEHYSPVVPTPKSERKKTQWQEIMSFGQTYSYSDLVRKIMETKKVKESWAKKTIKDGIETRNIFKNTAGFYFIQHENNQQDEMPF